MRVKNNQGFTLVEILLATALLSLFLAAVTASFVYGLRGVAWGSDRVRAVFLAEEGLAAVQNIRDTGFSGLSDGTFGLSSTGSQWAFSGSSDTTDIFTRQLIISSVDANTKSLISTVTWPKSAASAGSVSLVSRLTNWIANTVVGWSVPFQARIYDASGSQNGWKVQISGDYAYLVRSGGSPDFLIIDITDPLAPGLIGSLNLGSNPTNIAVSGNYAYVTGSSNTLELRIIDISVPSSPAIVGNYNAVGTANALGVAISGNTVFITRASSTDPEFISIDVTTKSAPTTLGSLDLGDAGNELVLSGSYAFIASSNDTQELQAVSVATPSAPTLIGWRDIGGTANSLTVALVGTTVFLGHGSNLRTFNIATPTVPIMINTLSLGAGISDFTTDGSNYLFAATAGPTIEFRVVDITTPAAPSIIASVDLTGIAANGVAYDPIRDQCAVAGEDNSAEFIMITHP